MKFFKPVRSTLLSNPRNLCMFVGLSIGFAVNAREHVAPTDGSVAEIVLESDVAAPMDFIVFDQADSCRGRSYVQRPTDQRRTAKVCGGLI